MDGIQIDIKENYLHKLNNKLLSILLKDRTSGCNLIWATDNYADRGAGYQSGDHITVAAVTGHRGNVIKPRADKSKKEQQSRVREKGEVFTPSWICNMQNNVVDEAWFGRAGVFNTETEDKGWRTTRAKVAFSEGKTWQDYVSENRMEITCGEAPYLVSRYDAVTGRAIEVADRIGLLDRKLRIVGENTSCEKEWVEWAVTAFQSVYGYEWQGDNVLLARENLLFTFIEHYTERFAVPPIIEYLRQIATIISWNIWQMDGLKFVIPNSCHDTEGEPSFFADGTEKVPCPGCKYNNYFQHNGIYSKIMDWKEKEQVRFADIVRRK